MMTDVRMLEALLIDPNVRLSNIFHESSYLGCQLFPNLPEKSSHSYKFVSLLLKCNGGGILVPILINAIPVTLAIDAYAIAIFSSFLLHIYVPMLRDVLNLSPIFKTSAIVLFEIMRASVVVKLTAAAGKAIPPSEFSFPMFGPIFCGTIAGCGGAFMPFNKGLDPIKDAGLAQPMLSAFIAATFYHLFTNTSLSEGVIKAEQKAQVLIAIFFITHNLATTFAGRASPVNISKPVPPSAGKKESKKSK